MKRFPKSASLADAGGIALDSWHEGDLNISGGALNIFVTKEELGGHTNYVYALKNSSDGTINIVNKSIWIHQLDSDSKRFYGIVSLGSNGINIDTGSLVIDKNPSSTQKFYSAIFAQGRGPISVDVGSLSIHDSNFPILAMSGGSIDINALDANINAKDVGNHTDSPITQCSVYVTGEGSSIIINDSGSPQLNTSGYMKSIENGNLSIRAGNGSILKHRSTVDDTATFKTTLLDNAIWYMPSNNSLTELVFEGGGCADFGHDYNYDNNGSPIYQSLTTKTLSGNSGTISFRMDLSQDATDKLSNDQVIVSDSALGSHFVNINFVTDVGSVPESKTHSANWLLSQGDSSDLTLTGDDGDNQFAGRGMITIWSLGFVPEGQEALLETEEGRNQIAERNTGTGSGNWYLVKHTVEEDLPPEIADNITIGTSASQALAYIADLEDLRKRIGEVRYGAQSGAWVKAFAKKDNVSASGGRGFEQDVYGINVGLDALAGTTESSSWLLGGAFRYARADQDGIGIASTSGNLDEYSVKAYATWMHEKGSYADFVLQAGRYEQELSGLDNTGSGSSHADYGTWGFGASVEIGHMFSFAEDADDRRWFNHFFIEPQLELSYFHARGADYSTSTGLRISQDNADFLTGRAGLVHWGPGNARKSH